MRRKKNGINIPDRFHFSHPSWNSIHSLSMQTTTRNVSGMSMKSFRERRNSWNSSPGYNRGIKKRIKRKLDTNWVLIQHADLHIETRQVNRERGRFGGISLWEVIAELIEISPRFLLLLQCWLRWGERRRTHPTSIWECWVVYNGTS